MVAFKFLQYFGFTHRNWDESPTPKIQNNISLNQEGFIELFRSTLDNLTQEKITYDCLFEKIYPLLLKHRALAQELFCKLPEEKADAYGYFKEWLKNLKEEKR